MRVPASSPAAGHHGELVGPGGGGVVQVVRRGGGLEGAVLSLVGGVRRVGRGQVGVVPPRRGGCHGRRHGDAQSAVGDGIVGVGVGEGGRCGGVVHPGVREGGERSF